MTATGLVFTVLIVLAMAALVLLGPRLTGRLSPPATDDPAPSLPHNLP
ncbi:hypothetical protein [Streptomyces sp. AP-93]|nr:hypothetical protein [Streptomyces sp. AP-93]MCJ0872524.1 hypothetical protein [Streptomyces sp. AP-93]